MPLPQVLDGPINGDGDSEVGQPDFSDTEGSAGRLGRTTRTCNRLLATSQEACVTSTMRKAHFPQKISGS